MKRVRLSTKVSIELLMIVAVATLGNDEQRAVTNTIDPSLCTTGRPRAGMEYDIIYQGV